VKPRNIVFFQAPRSGTFSPQALRQHRMHGSVRRHMSPQRSGTLSSTPLLALLHRSPPLPLLSSTVTATGRRRTKGRSEEKGQGEGGEPPGPQSLASQHCASLFCPISPCTPPPCSHDPCACACHRWWPNMFFSPSSSSRSQGPISISSSTIGRELLCIS
jgi:hypothetical protein